MATTKKTDSGKPAAKQSAALKPAAKKAAAKKTAEVVDVRQAKAISPARAQAKAAHETPAKVPGRKDRWGSATRRTARIA